MQLAHNMIDQTLVGGLLGQNMGGAMGMNMPLGQNMGGVMGVNMALG